MAHYWNYLNQANWQINLQKLNNHPDNQIHLALLMRMLRRELSLRFERRSFVYADDDSQKLFDRWNNREVWAFVPTVNSPVYAIEGVGDVSPREVSIIRQAQAFSLAVPSIIKESSIGTLVLMKKLVESTLQEGVDDIERILSRLANANLIKVTNEGLTEIAFPMETPTGLTILLAPEKKFYGGFQMNREQKAWRVSIIDELSGVINETDDKKNALISASTDTIEHRERSFRMDSANNISLKELREWIDNNIKQLEQRKNGMAKYDVALSFAGEDRQVVEEIAARLIVRGYNVFYDKYEQADLWGKDLYQHLASIYSEQATFCIVFISDSYRQKLWTKHELRYAQARAFRESQEYILPVRLDDTQLPALPETIGYLNLKDIGIDGLVDLLSHKLENFI